VSSHSSSDAVVSIPAACPLIDLPVKILANDGRVHDEVANVCSNTTPCSANVSRNGDVGRS
jgi:hypothetical protein